MIANLSPGKRYAVVVDDGTGRVIGVDSSTTVEFQYKTCSPPKLTEMNLTELMNKSKNLYQKHQEKKNWKAIRDIHKKRR